MNKNDSGGPHYFNFHSINDGRAKFYRCHTEHTYLHIEYIEIDGNGAYYSSWYTKNLKINGTTYNGSTDVDFSDTINEMIDAKIPEVPSLEGYAKTEDITTAVNDALTQAKESGEFDGAPGADGKDGADGEDGADGKSAYAYAQDGGYTGTEAEFAEKLAKEYPAALPNPNKLILTGAVFAEYDGSGAVTVEIPSGGEANTETVLSDNLFDKSTVTNGQLFYHSSSGPTLTDSTDVCYAYVPLRGSGTYRTKVNYQEHGSYANRVPILTEDKTFIQNVTGTVTETDNRYAADLEFTITQDMVDSGAALYAFDCHTSILSTVMIVKDREYPDSYISYGYIEVATDSGKKQDNVLCEKTAVFLGDSICAGTTVAEDSGYYNYGWGGIIGEANHMTWGNYGKNGGTIIPMESVAEERWVLTQVDTAYAAHPKADYVIFEGGCNDADTLIADESGLGTLSDSYAPTSTADFTSAFESLVLKLLTKFPGARIGYVIPQKMQTADNYRNNERVYFDRAVEICEKWGIPVLDLWKTCPLNPKLSMFYDSSLTDAENCYTDGQHLTLKGYQRITPKIEAFMRNL